jgi:pentatricopeptide repeat protein
METYGHKRTAETYDMIMKCIAKNQEFERALDTLDEMKELGITPLDTTYMNVLILAVEYGSPTIAFDMLKNIEALGTAPDPNWCMMALRCAAVYDHVRRTMKITHYCFLTN